MVIAFGFPAEHGENDKDDEGLRPPLSDGSSIEL
jgi:hypothetical protein